MDSVSEMRKLIDAVKAESFTAPLPQVVQNLTLLSTATKDLSDRLAIRINKKLDDKPKTKNKKSKKSVPKIPVPKSNSPQHSTAQKPTSATNNNSSLPTSNPVSSSSVSSNDYNTVAKNFASQQQSLNAIQPIPPQ